MTPAIIISKALLDGVKMAVSDHGNIIATGDPEAVKKWTPTIRDNKPEIVKALRAAPPALAPDLHRRILEMARRWSYTDAELATVLRDAAANPAGWLLTVACDETGDWGAAS